MGQDKAMLLLGGKPLLEHAHIKLDRICQTVKVLSSNPDHAAFAPTVQDNFPGSGPLGGIEAALQDSFHEWNLIYPVDVPFLTTRLLDDWLWCTVRPPTRNLRVSMIAVNQQAHPTLLLIHRDLGPYLRDALRMGDRSVRVALDAAAALIAQERQCKVEEVFWQPQYDDPRSPKWRDKGQDWRKLPPGYSAGADEFRNLNTPEDFAEAEKHLDALDT